MSNSNLVLLSLLILLSSVSGHMLLNLSHSKHDFFKEIVESFANKSGQSALFDALFGTDSCRKSSFLGTDDIRNVGVQAPESMELTRYDIGKRSENP